MCPDCDGLGITLEMDEDLVVPAPELSLRDGAVPLLGAPASQRAKCMMEAFETQLGRCV